MLLAIEILGILTMITIMFVLIWGFILLTQIFGQLRYKNYLMEKLIQTIYLQKKNEGTIENKEEKSQSQ
jgi:hypothetical protein